MEVEKAQKNELQMEEKDERKKNNKRRRKKKHSQDERDDLDSNFEEVSTSDSNSD